jgi:hypothetical protein
VFHYGQRAAMFLELLTTSPFLFRHFLPVFMSPA